MHSANGSSCFESINPGYDQTLQFNKLTLGLVVPIESYQAGKKPTMQDHIEKVKQVEQLGFSAIWLRDVPFDVPSFGDVGQMYDPFVYLGMLAAVTETITLGAASIVLPTRHPAHVAKAAASVDVLSGGRLILGVASGDRPDEYPALNKSFENRGQHFRESFEYINKMAEQNPVVNNHYGVLNQNIDMLPKPYGQQLPLVVTGSSQQSMEWIAKHSHGWMTYPKDIEAQGQIITNWQHMVKQTGRSPQPVIQPLYIDLVENDDCRPSPVHLGFRMGVNYLNDYLTSLQDLGVNHVALNLRFNQANIENTLNRLATKVLPNFTTTPINNEGI